MAEPITMQKLTNASIDADTLGEFTNEDKVVISRMGAEYPSAPMASRLLVENGLAGADIYKNYAKMAEVSATDGDYAVVTNDSDTNKNGVYVWDTDKWLLTRYSKHLSPATVFFRVYSDTTIHYDASTRTLSTDGQVVMLTDSVVIKDRVSLVIPPFSITIPMNTYQVVYIDLSEIPTEGSLDPAAFIKVGGYFKGEDLYQSKPHQVPIFTKQGSDGRGVNGFFEGQIEGVPPSLEEKRLDAELTTIASEVEKNTPFATPLFFKASTSSTISYDAATRTLSSDGLLVVNLPSDQINDRQSVLIPEFSIDLGAGTYRVVYIDLRTIEAGTGWIDPSASLKVASYMHAEAGEDLYQSKPYQVPIFTKQGADARGVTGFFEGQIEGASPSLEEERLGAELVETKERLGSLEKDAASFAPAEEINARVPVYRDLDVLKRYSRNGEAIYYDPAPYSILSEVTQNPKNALTVIDKPTLRNRTPVFVNDGTDFTGSPIVIPSDREIMIVIPSFGQSNSVGAQGYAPPEPLTKNEYGDSLLMPAGNANMDIRMNLPSGTESVGAEVVLDPATITGFQPLMAMQSVARDNQGATPLEAMGLVLAKNLHKTMGIRPKICMYTAGWGGRFQADLSKGTIPYQNLLTALERVRRLAARDGYFAYVPFIALIHGESDSTKSVYLEGIKTWQSDFESDIKAITGQVGDVPFLCSQASTFTGSNTHGVLAPYFAAKNSNTHYVAAPYYPYEFATDNLHLGESAGFVGEKLAHAACRIAGLFGSASYGSVQPTSIVYDNAKKITVNFHVPVKPLVGDTSYTETSNPPADNWGFVVKDGSGSAVTITDIRVVGGDTVEITTESIVSEGSYRAVEYALNGFGSQKVFGEQARGSLRDSENLPSIIDGRPLHNWCVHFKELF